jgi:hypothetical protein
MKPRNVSVSVVENGDEIKVWCASFTLKGYVPRHNGLETGRHKVEKQIQKALEQVEFDLTDLDRWH